MSYELCGHCGKPKKPTLPLSSADAVLTSPPWADEREGAGLRNPGHPDGERKGLTHWGYTRPAAIVTSPPFEDQEATKAGKFADPVKSAELQSANYRSGKSKGHFASAAAILKAMDAQKPYPPGATANIGNLRGGDLYALLVYNRLRKSPMMPVEVALCGKCLPAEIAESLSADMPPDANLVGPNIQANYSTPNPPGVVATSALTVAPKSPVEPHAASHVRQPISVGKTTMNGKVDIQHGEDWLGISSDGQCLNGTTTSVPNADRGAWLSIISKVQRKLAENGITASETWLRSARVATTENMPLSGCILCNALLADKPSSPEMRMLCGVLHLQFVTPNIAPLSALAGGQKGNYWLSMLQVYEECFRLIKPQGLMVLVLKGFTRDGKYVDLPGQTEALLLAAGWEKHDEWQRELWSLSFWRILQRRRDPAAFDDRLLYETVLAFRKPVGDGDGVAAVVTSPPYANRVDDHGVDQEGWDGFSERFGRYTRPSTIITLPPTRAPCKVTSQAGCSLRRSGG